MGLKKTGKIKGDFPVQANSDVAWPYRLFGMVVPKKTTPGKSRLLAGLFGAAMKKDDMYYSVPLDNIVNIDQPLEYQQSILPSQLIHHFIDKASHLAVAKYCMCRTKMDCKNFSKEYGCLLLGEGVADLSPKMVDQVSREEAHEYIDKVRKEGLVNVIGRTFADTLAFRLGREASKYHKKFMIICNCCTCCCLVRLYPHGRKSMKDMFKKIPGVEVRVTDGCKGCGTCADPGVCMFDAIRFNEGGKAWHTDDCVACGRCVSSCPEKAIEITISENSVKEAVETLSDLVDVS